MRASLRFVLGLVLLVVFATATSAEKGPTPRSANGPCGRYQVFQGSIGYQNEQKMDVVLRLDTQTGQTWFYLVPANTWSPVSER
jgi:hypothetical protein